jgi:cytochrome c oxidase cbb3-type subunit 1
MDSAILSLFGAFALSILGLFAFIWSLRQGLLIENPQGASVIFAQGELGKVDDPALSATQNAKFQAQRQRAMRVPLSKTKPP